MSAIEDKSGEHPREYIDSLDKLCQIILDIRQRTASDQRVLVAVAGAPGSGKSTLAESLPALLNAALSGAGESAVVVPMDGYHLDNAVLDAHGTRAVKGSPQTYDVSGFVSLLHRVAVRGAQAVYVPVFDREADFARNACQTVAHEHSVAIVEGNYLLLNRAEWSDLSLVFDCTIMLDVPLETLESRLVQRWLDHGHTPEQAEQRALSNDIPNARVVLAESITADLYYKSVR